jgi:hypothetical protein
MVLSPEARSEINKRNASHARGPVTEAGKNKSKYNALKHGGRAETLVLPNEDPAEAQALHDQWHGFYAARSPAQAAYLDKIVHSLRRAERLRRAEDQMLDDQVRAATEHYDAAQQEQVDSFEAMLKEDPAAATRGLMRTAAGCRWMLEQWDDLKTELLERGAWVTSQRETAVRLMGIRPEATREDETAYLIRLWNLVAMPDRNEEALDRLLSPEQVPDTIRSWQANMEPAVEDCRRFLAEAVEREVVELTEREKRLRVEIEEPARAGVAERALVLEGEEGWKLHRYQVTADNDFHRAYQGFLKARAQEEKLIDMDPSAPLPNEPNPPVAAEEPPLLDEPNPPVVVEEPPLPNEPNPAVVAGPAPLPNEPNRAAGPDPIPAEIPGSDDVPPPGPAADRPGGEAAAPLPNEPKSADAPRGRPGPIGLADPLRLPLEAPFAAGSIPASAPTG